jgi:hypothetical protein
VTPIPIPPTHKLAAGHFDGDGCVFLSAGHFVPVDQVAAALMPGAPVHHGVHVLELGDDGGSYGIAGHPTRRRALAAVRRYMRVDCGLTGRADLEDLRHARIEQRWIVPELEDGELIWNWEREPVAGAQPITVVDL